MKKEETRKCGECLAEIPKKAKKCSHCGSKQKEKFGIKHLFLIIIIVIIFSAIFSSIGDDNNGSSNIANTSSSSSQVDDSKAFVIAKNYVKLALKSPSTADFPLLDYSATKISENEFEVTSYVDSQNSFGAEIRTTWEATLMYMSGDWADQRNWILEELIIDGKSVYPIAE